MPEIVTFEQQRLAGGRGQGVGEAVAEVQAGGAAAAATVGAASNSKPPEPVAYRPGW